MVLPSLMCFTLHFFHSFFFVWGCFVEGFFLSNFPSFPLWLVVLPSQQSQTDVITSQHPEMPHGCSGGFTLPATTLSITPVQSGNCTVVAAFTLPVCSLPLCSGHTKAYLAYFPCQIQSLKHVVWHVMVPLKINKGQTLENIGSCTLNYGSMKGDQLLWNHSNAWTLWQHLLSYATWWSLVILALTYIVLWTYSSITQPVVPHILKMGQIPAQKVNPKVYHKF